MAKTVELFYTIQNGCPSLTFRIADVIEGDAKAKFQEMLNDLPAPIADSLKNLPPTRLLPNNEVVVQEVPSTKASTMKPRSFKSGNDEGITEKQHYCIRQWLERQKLSEKDFCQKYSVDSLKDLPKNVATGIVSEIKGHK